MRRPSIFQLLPNAIELGYVAVIAFVVILLGTGKLILERLGMIGSAHLIGAQVSTKVTSGLDSLTRFQFTGNAFDFIIWGGTGLVIYSVLQSVVRALRTAAYRRDFDSREYIHPKQFKRDTYWGQIATDTVLGFVLLVLMIVGAILYVVVALPASFAYARRFILAPGLSTAFDPLLSLAVALIATTVLYFLIKLVVRHHRVSAAIEADPQNFS